MHDRAIEGLLIELKQTQAWLMVTDGLTNQAKLTSNCYFSQNVPNYPVHSHDFSSPFPSSRTRP